MRLFNGRQTIWTEDRALAEAGLVRSYTIELQWLQQRLSLSFPSALYGRAGGRLPAYDATVRVFDSAAQRNQLLEVELDENGALLYPSPPERPPSSCPL